MTPEGKLAVERKLATPSDYICQLYRGCRGNLTCMKEDKKQRAGSAVRKEQDEEHHRSIAPKKRRRPVGRVEEMLSHNMVHTRSWLRNHNGNHKIGRGIRKSIPQREGPKGRMKWEQEKGVFFPLYWSRILTFSFLSIFILYPPCGTSLAAPIFVLYTSF